MPWSSSIWFWIGFNVFLLSLLALDLGVFHRKAHAVSFKEASIWSAVWIGIALAFNAGLWYFTGPEPALLFLTGYLIEKSLAIDNIFVIVMLFTSFAVPAAYQHRVLFIGVVSALVMRGAFIAAGSYLITQFQWLLLVFGAFLVFTGLKMAFTKQHSIDIEKNLFVRIVKRFFPVLNEYRGASFLVREGGRWVATPLLLVLALVEFTDLIFAVDSIPAIFAVTTDPFLVYTSNALAILGMRSLYFMLAGLAHRFKYLKYGLSAILVFVGTKMLLIDVVKVQPFVSLAIVLGILAVSIVASLLTTRGQAPLPSEGHA